MSSASRGQARAPFGGTLNFYLGAIFIVALAGCEASLSEALNPDLPAVRSAASSQGSLLREAPRPKRGVNVAVYGLPDLTGQYKEDDLSQTLSRAVTQGGSGLLIQALRAAGNGEWFNVLDRTQLDNILRERQILTEMRRIYLGEDEINQEALGPLSHSNYIVEGAITGYDTNVLTGGMGARYLGIGGSTQWKLDIITVTMRIVSVETSKVLVSVNVRKPIASHSKRGSVFTYVALDQIVEGETGTTVNEPKQVAVEEAIEKAVLELIVEGTREKLWSFHDAAVGEAFLTNLAGEDSVDIKVSSTTMLVSE